MLNIFNILLREIKQITDSRLFLVSLKENGDPLSQDDIRGIKSYIREIFSEIQSTITKINETIPKNDIRSVLLNPFDSDLIHHIKYNNIGAAGFIHALFNSTARIARLASTIIIDETPFVLPNPSLVEDKVLFDAPHVVYGVFTLESLKSKSLIFSGHYLDGNSLTENKFENKMIYCKGNGENKKKFDELFEKVITDYVNKKVKAIILPQQNYVCLYGVESKSKYLSSAELINLSPSQ